MLRYSPISTAIFGTDAISFSKKPLKKTFYSIQFMCWTFVASMLFMTTMAMRSNSTLLIITVEIEAHTHPAIYYAKENKRENIKWRQMKSYYYNFFCTKKKNLLLSIFWNTKISLSIVTMVIEFVRRRAKNMT